MRSERVVLLIILWCEAIIRPRLSRRTFRWWQSCVSGSHWQHLARCPQPGQLLVSLPWFHKWIVQWLPRNVGEKVGKGHRPVPQRRNLNACKHLIAADTYLSLIISLGPDDPGGKLRDTSLLWVAYDATLIQEGPDVVAVAASAGKMGPEENVSEAGI
jgi:hypothetical protein